MDELYQAYLNATGVCTDTRKITRGCIFFALKGENFNGNKFAKEAISLGASVAVIDEAEFQSKNMILVDDVLTSLQELAKHHRNQLSIPVIGLTGSNGKTTTKELIAAVLQTSYNVFATYGNLNNHIGVPLSLLSILPEHEIAIIEMGANHQKEIEFLANLSQPSHGLITNIGKAHLEGFGGPEGVLKGKRELYDNLESNNSIVFLNAADPILNKIRPATEIIEYGGDSTISGKILDDKELLHVAVNIEESQLEIQTNLVGGYNLANILAATCIGHYFNVPRGKIKKGLEQYEPTNNRSQFLNTGRNAVVLDAYNANPSSIEAALRNFANRNDDHKLVILGDMLELGPESDREHHKIVELVEELELAAILVGSEFARVAQLRFPTFESAQSALTHLSEQPINGHAILIKGSRGIKLETVLEAL